MTLPVHKQNQAGDQGPLCIKLNPDLKSDIYTPLSNNVDLVTCVDCLRMLAKDAVIYGNRRRAERKW